MAYEHGYQMMVFDHEYWDRDPQALRRWLTESEISGVLILGDMEETLAANIVSCGLPVVAVGTRPQIRFLRPYIRIAARRSTIL